MSAQRVNINAWKLSTIVLLAVLLGFILAQLTGLGLVSAQAGGEMKVQLDTSNCNANTRTAPLPKGAFVVQVIPNEYGTGKAYVYNMCK